MFMGDAPAMKSCPPAIAQGVYSNINIRLCHADAVTEWKRVHGAVPVRNLDRKTTGGYIPRAKPVVYSGETYSFIGEVNHRRPGSLGGLFIDWLIANPGSTQQQMKDAGHDLKHLRWDILKNPEKFLIVQPKV